MACNKIRSLSLSPFIYDFFIFVNFLGFSEEENKPPVADAGPHKELSLPDDSTTLDGSGSRDDVAIATYLWEMIKQVAV